MKLGSFNVEMDVSTGVSALKDADDWTPDFPNPPDRRFNYFKLLDEGKQSGIGVAGAKKKVAVIGAGAAGMSAARELYRSGFDVTIYEASDRIGGRLYTQPIMNDAGTSLELGAMRFPFFSGSGDTTTALQSQNCLLAYYLLHDQSDNDPVQDPDYRRQAKLSAFPNPGAAPGGTGIYINDGFGPLKGGRLPFQRPTLIQWDKGSGGPDNPDLMTVTNILNTFITFFTDIAKAEWAKATTDKDDPWLDFWIKVANNYEKMTFEDMVRTPVVKESDYNNDGWFGGLGMTDDQISILAAIGTGDGSWGAFYNVGAMWWMRCSLFGFSTNLQTVAGFENSTSDPLPYYGSGSLTDTAGNSIPGPLYRGIQSVCELLLFMPPPEGGDSLYDATQGGNCALYTRTPVTKIRKDGDSLFVQAGTQHSDTFDHVVVASPTWATQLSIQFEGFSKDIFPAEVTAAINQQHIIASCKVFYPLTQPYWAETDASAAPTDIPQIIVTDTAVQDAYGLKWNAGSGGSGGGAVLASYTWEDDARKLLATPDEELADFVLAGLDRIISETTTGGDRIDDYIDRSQKPVVFHWILQPSFRGCAKLYRAWDWNNNYALLTYNQLHSADSGLCFAGEAYDVEGGWTEPALRGGVDATIRIIANSGGSFNNPNFTIDQYPDYRTDVRLDPIYPQSSASTMPSR